MGKILGQSSSLKILSGIYKNDRLHHAYFFYGERGIGKYESALNFAKTILCEKNNGTYCDECKSCVSINNYRHNDVIVLGTSERFTNAEIFYEQFRKSKAEHLFNDFISSVRYILYRLESTLLPAYVSYPFSANEKYMVGSKKENSRDLLLESYYLAISNTIKELNKNNIDDIHGIYKKKSKDALETIKNRGSSKKNISITGDFFEGLKKLYYNIVYTVLPLDSIRKVIELTTRKPTGIKRIFIIEGIDLMDKTSSNIFLRTLEEPFDNNIFILLSDNPNIISDTSMKPLFSRLMGLHFANLSKQMLDNIYRKRLKFNDEEIKFCLSHSDGSVDRGLKNLLDKNRDIDNNGRELLVSFFRAIKEKEADSLAKCLTSLCGEGIEVLKSLVLLLSEMIASRYILDENTNIFEGILYNIKDEVIIGIIEEIDSSINILVNTNVQEKIVLRKVFTDIVICLKN